MPRSRLSSTHRMLLAPSILLLAGLAQAPPARAQSAPEPAPPRVVVTDSGQIVVTDGVDVLGQVLISITAVDFATGHADQESNATQVRSRMEGGRRIVDGAIEVPGSGGRRMEYHQEVTAVSGMELKLTYRCKFPEQVTIFGYYVTFHFAVAPIIGQPIRVAASPPRTVTLKDAIPAIADAFYHIGPAGELQVAPDSPAGFTLTPSEEMHLLMQDNRAWAGDVIEARYHFRNSEQREVVPAGDTIERSFTLRYNRPMRSVLDPKDGDATDTRGWIPYSIASEKPAVDLSFLNDKPAGSHGFLAVTGDRFAFQDGAPARFWGTNLTGRSAFPSKEEADATARRLAAYGVNLVRVVGATSGGDDPLVASWDGDRPKLDAAVLARLDDLIAALRREGIYVALDQSLVPAPRLGHLPPSANPYYYFDAVTVTRNKAVARAFWSHVNPRTGMAYKDEPAIAMVELVNVCDLFINKIVSEPQRSRLEERYRAWAAANSVTVDAKPVDFATLSPPVAHFLSEVQHDYYRDMARALRQAGVRVPIAGSNWCQSAPELASLSGLDYIHAHADWDNPTLEVGGDPKPMVKSPNVVYTPLLAGRLAGKPFAVAGWAVPWSCDWRAELTLALSAVAAMQEWNALTLHVYGAGSGDATGRIRVPECATDPAIWGPAYHAALLFRRGDVHPSRERRTLFFSEQDAFDHATRVPWDVPTYRSIAEARRLDTAIGKEPPANAALVKADDDPLANEKEAIASDTGELRRDLKHSVGTIDTASTQAVYGMAGMAGPIKLSDLQVAAKTPYATIALSSLTGTGIAASDHLLLTAIGRAENTGQRYNALHTEVVRQGSAPVLIEPIEADVRIRTASKLQVRPVAADGSRGAPLAATYEAGWLSFHIGAAARTMYYEIGR